MNRLADVRSGDLYRTLRDIRDGHITLHVTVQRYNPSTGHAVTPWAMSTGSDRAPAGVALRAMDDWWLALAQEGWLRLPDLNEPQVWMLTEQSEQWIDRHAETP